MPLLMLNQVAFALILAVLATTPPALAKDDALLAAATAEQPAVVKTLEKLVNIETGAGDAIGMAEIATVLEGDLKSLGAAVTRHKAEGDAVGDTSLDA